MLKDLYSNYNKYVSLTQETFLETREYLRNNFNYIFGYHTSKLLGKIDSEMHFLLQDLPTSKSRLFELVSPEFSLKRRKDVSSSKAEESGSRPFGSLVLPLDMKVVNAAFSQGAGLLFSDFRNTKLRFSGNAISGLHEKFQSGHKFRYPFDILEVFEDRYLVFKGYKYWDSTGSVEVIDLLGNGNPDFSRFIKAKKRNALVRAFKELVVLKKQIGSNGFIIREPLGNAYLYQFSSDLRFANDNLKDAVGRDYRFAELEADSSYNPDMSVRGPEANCEFFDIFEVKQGVELNDLYGSEWRLKEANDLILKSLPALEPTLKKINDKRKVLIDGLQDILKELKVENAASKTLSVLKND